MDRNYTGKELVGAKVKALEFTVEIAKVLYAEYWEREGYDIEFLDPRGGYHHWKQWDDGGEIMFPIPKWFKVGESGGKYYDKDENPHYIDYYGTDVTDLFRKYGYNV